MAKRKPFIPDPATVRWAIRRVRNMRWLAPLAYHDVLSALAHDLLETSRQLAAIERKPKGERNA